MEIVSITPSAALQGSSLGRFGGDLEAIKSAFISQLDTRSSRTLDSYLHNIGYYLDWIEATGRNINTLSKVDIIAFRDYLSKSEGLAPNTIAAYLSIVRKFYKWAQGMGLYLNITEDVKLPKRELRYERDYLPADLAKRLQALAATFQPRDYAIILLMLHNGLRTIEIVRANVGDLQAVAGRRLLRVQGKGHTEKDDFVVLDTTTATAIDSYLATREPDSLSEDSPLFLSKAHNLEPGRLNTITPRRTARAALDGIGLTNEAFNRAFSAHSLRHTFASLSLEMGKPITEVQQELRHSSVNTTMIYLKKIAKRKRLESSFHEDFDNFLK